MFVYQSFAQLLVRQSAEVISYDRGSAVSAKTTSRACPSRKDTPVDAPSFPYEVHWGEERWFHIWHADRRRLCISCHCDPAVPTMVVDITGGQEALKTGCTIRQTTIR